MRLTRTFPTGGLLLGLVVLVGSVSRPVAAQDAQATNSLDLVSEDSSLYVNFSRNREQVEAITESNVWKKFWALKAVKQGWKDSQEQLPNDAEKPFWETEEWKEFEPFATDLVSNEVFLHADRAYVDVTKLSNLYTRASYRMLIKKMIREGLSGAALEPLIAGDDELAGDDEPDEDDEPAELTEEDRRDLLEVAKVMAEHTDLIKVPVFTLGFKVSDKAAAKKMLPRAYEVLLHRDDITEEQKQKQKQRVQKAYKKVIVGGEEFHTMRLDFKELADDEGKELFKDLDDSDPAIKRLKKKILSLTFTFSLGFQGDYLLLSVGPSLDHVKQLGKGKVLRSHADLKPLANAPAGRLASVWYASAALQEETNFKPEDVEYYSNLILEYVPFGDLPVELTKRIQSDVEELSDDLSSLFPRQGSWLSYSLLTDQGYERFTFAHTDKPLVNATKPLALLEHVGGSPYFASVSRESYRTDYATLTKWMAKAQQYFEDFGLAAADPETQERYRKNAKAARPYWKRLDAIIREHWIPAFKNGESAFVIGLASEAPQTPDLLPGLKIAEPAWVYTVSDADALRKSYKEMKSLVDDWVASVAENNPDEVPDFTIPEPSVLKIDDGTLYYYVLPEELAAGAGDGWGMYLGLSDDVAVFAFSKTQAEILLKKTPLVGRGPLKKWREPTGSAFVLDWSSMMRDYGALLELGAQFAAAQAANLPDEDVGPDDLTPMEQLEHLKVVLDLLEAFKGVSSRVYLQDGAVVTHTVYGLQDVK
ncbi:MAG: hypothetical protein N2C14_21565 [Planctomycetales bacterium]